jgi:glucose/arabinose dehydrogenase
MKSNKIRTLELRDLIFAQGFDTVTDLQVDPDGYLYVLSYSAKIFKVFPRDI